MTDMSNGRRPFTVPQRTASNFLWMAEHLLKTSKLQTEMIDQVIKESLKSMIHKSVEDIERACQDPESEKCREYNRLFSNGQAGASGSP